MKRFKTPLALLGLMLPTLAQASTWDLDPAHSNIGFKVRHAMISNVHGAFGKALGTVVVDDKDMTKSHGDFTIDVSSVDTRSDKRDAHLKGEDFFDVKKYPEITFKTTKIIPSGKTLKVHGNLTMHGMTKQVILSGQAPAKAVKDPFGMVRSGVTLTGKINRKDYNLMWNKALEAGGLMVGEEIEIQIDAEFVRKDSIENNPGIKAAPSGEPTGKQMK